MNLKNKTDKELWDMLPYWQRLIKENNPYVDMEVLKKEKYDIHKEIIRREKDNEIGVS